MGKTSANLEELLIQIEGADSSEKKITIDRIMDEVGRRSFAPLLILAGIITVIPIIGDIPGVPTTMGVFVLLTSSQMLFLRDQFWLPDWILKRSLRKDNLKKGLKWMYKPARFIDRWTRTRLTWFVQGVGQMTIIIICLLIALVMPVIDLIPFSGNIAGLAFILFGLSLITQDGLLALFALIFAIGTFGVIVYVIF